MKPERNYQTKELATLLGVSVKTLDKFRRSGTGPQFARIGRRILYRSDDVEKFSLRKQILFDSRVLQPNTIRGTTMSERELAHTANLHALVRSPVVSPGKRILPTFTASELADRINSALQQTINELLKTAGECVTVDDYLKGKAREDFFLRLNISKSMFSKWVGIGRCDSFRKESVKRYLPLSITTLYELCRFSNKELELAIAQKKLTPDTTRQDVLGWKSELQDSNPKSANSSSVSASSNSKVTKATDEDESGDSSSLSFTIELHPNISASQRAEFLRWIDGGRNLPAVKGISPN